MKARENQVFTCWLCIRNVPDQLTSAAALGLVCFFFKVAVVFRYQLEMVAVLPRMASV